MTATRKKLYQNALEMGRIRFERDKWWILCREHTDEQGHNVYRAIPTRQYSAGTADKKMAMEERCLDAVRDSVRHCTGKCRERLI